MSQKRCLSLLMLLLFTAFSLTNAQEVSFLPDNLEPITVENFDRITQLAMLGTGTIENIAWSPDNQTIALAGSGGLRLYNTNNLSADPRWFIGHTGKVNDIVFNSDGTSLVSVGDDSLVRWWDVATGDLISSFCPYHAESDCVYASVEGVSLSPDDSLMSVGLNSGMLVFDTQSNTQLFDTLGNGIRIHFSPDGTLLAGVGGRDGSITIWEVNEGTFDTSFEIDVPFEIWDFAFSPDSQSIALAGYSAEFIELFDLTTREIIAQYAGEYTVSIHPDATELAASQALWDGEKFVPHVNIWSLETDELLEQLPFEASISRLRYSPDGSRLAVGYRDGGLSIWDTNDYTSIGDVEGRGAAVRDLALMDNTLISLDGLSYDIRTPLGGGTSYGDSIRAWDIHTGRELNSWHSTEIHPELNIINGSLRYLLNTSQFLLVSPYQPYPYLWNMLTQDVDRLNWGEFENIELMTLNTDASLMVGVIRNNIYIWDVSDGFSDDLHSIQMIPAQNTDYAERFIDLAFHPTDNVLMTLKVDGTIQRWDISTGEELDSLTLHQLAWSIDFNPDGTLLVVGGGPSRLFSSDTLTEIAVLRNEHSSGGASAFMFNADGSILAAIYSHGFGGDIALWDIDDPNNPVVLQPAASRLIFNADNTLLISAGYDGMIRFWGVPAD